MKKIIFIFLMMCVVVPGFVLAVDTPGGGGANTPVGGTSNPPGGGGQNNPIGGGGNSGGSTSNPNVITWKIVNPLSIGSDVSSIVTAIMKNIVMPLAAVLVVLAILYSGFKFVIAQGNSKELQDARQGLLWVLIGSAILLGAYGISEALQKTIEQIVPLK